MHIAPYSKESSAPWAAVPRLRNPARMAATNQEIFKALQIVLALIIESIGAVFAFNYFKHSQRFPLVFCTGYPFWGAVIFIITGYVTGFNTKGKSLEKGIMAMNVISSLAAVAGITLTIFSFQYQHRYCEVPSTEGICAIGRIFFNGILSVLLIISLVELSISVTTASFQSKCWTRSDEIVFFLPMAITPESELSVPEENAVIQFDLHQESNNDDLSTNIQPVFFGGYTFFKLRVSKNLTFHRSGKRDSNDYYTPSSTESDEQQKNIPPSSKYYEEEVELEPLSPEVEKKPSEDISHTEQINDEDLQLAIEHPPEMQTQPLPDEAHPVKALPPYDLLSQAMPAQALPPEALTHHGTDSHDLISKDMPSQDMLSQVQELPTQALLSAAPVLHITQSYDLISEDVLSQDMPPQDMPFQVRVLPTQALLSAAPTFHIAQSYDVISKDMTSQDIQSQSMSSQNMFSQEQAMQFEAQTFHAEQALSAQNLEQQFLGHHLQNTQHQDQEFTSMSYQNIQSEVHLLTQDWKYEKHQSKKFSRQHSFDKHSKHRQSSTKKSLDMTLQDQQFPRKKSLDQHIKGWLSPKRHSIDKQVQNKQFSDQQAEEQLTQGKQSPKQKSQGVQVEEEKSPEQLGQHLQSQIQKYQDWQSLGQQSQAWGTQRWTNKDYKAQEYKFEMKHSMNWESQDWRTQDLLEKEFRKQKVLYKEAQTLHAVPQPHLDQQAQNVLFPDRQHQDKKQRDLRSTGIRKEDMQIVPVKTKDMQLVDYKSLCQNPSDVKSEDTKPDFHHSSCQSLVQDSSSIYLSNEGSEQDVQDVQENTSISSNLTSCYTKDQQQSEDSD